MYSRPISLVLAALALASTAGARAGAGELELSGSATAELRTFTESPTFGGQLDGGQASVAFEPELEWQSEDRRDQFHVVGFWRHDDADDERSHGDVREAYWRRTTDNWQLLAGINRVFWGVTESRHLVDVINQSDVLERLDGEAKLGQPMIELSSQRSWGRLSGYALLGFRERAYPGPDGRLRPPLPVADDAVFESASGDDHVDVAVRWSHSPGAFDLGVHVFHGTSREPRLVPAEDGDALVAHYDRVTQAGLDAQLTLGAWLGKLEVLARSNPRNSFAAAVAGVEHTCYQVFGSAADVGLLAEYLWDGRGPGAPPTPFDDDVFVGVRVALNDLQDTSLLAGWIVDRNDGSALWQLELSRRIAQGFTAEVEAHWFAGTQESPALAAFGQDDYYSVSIARHF